MSVVAPAQNHQWKYVATGDASSYAIDSDGSLWAWGWNESGQLGIGESNQKVSVPTKVGSDTDWKSVFAGQAYAFFLKKDGTLWAVGANEKGVSGVGDAAAHKTPSQIGTDNHWSYVACSHFFGYAALGIKSDGTLWAWGEGENYALGTGKSANLSTPQQIGSDNDWASVAIGDSYTIALKKDGSLWGWGFNDKGIVFSTSDLLVKTPTRLGADTDWNKVFAAATTAYGIKKDGSLWVWGYCDNNTFGIDGDAEGYIKVPTRVTSIPEPVISITGSDNSRVAAVGDLETGLVTKLYSWGTNADGALGNGTGVPADQTNLIKYVSNPSPVNLTGMNLVQIASGVGYTLALSDNGKIYGWGKNRGGQLGNSVDETGMTFRSTPAEAAVPEPLGEGIYKFDSENIPSKVSSAKTIILTGEWGTADFQKLSVAIGNNTGFPPAGNSTIEEVDMSKAKITPGTDLNVPIGFSNYGVFRGLKSLKKVEMPLAEEAAHFSNMKGAFQNCTKLEAIDMTGCTGVTKLTDTFFGCENLKEVNLSNCNSLGTSQPTESTFDHCTGLETVILPASFTWSDYIFGSCTSLRTIDWSRYSSAKAPQLEDQKLKDYMFQYIDNLKTIKLLVPSAAYNSFMTDSQWSQLDIQTATSTGINCIRLKPINVIYTLNGLRVDEKQVKHNGVYIMNGKKVMVRK